jgi:hypothetical protein
MEAISLFGDGNSLVLLKVLLRVQTEFPSLQQFPILTFMIVVMVHSLCQMEVPPVPSSVRHQSGQQCPNIEPLKIYLFNKKSVDVAVGQLPEVAEQTGRFT